MPAATYGTPAYWRERAEEARAKAAEMRDRDARQAMLDIANSYDHLAKMAERRGASPSADQQ